MPSSSIGRDPCSREPNVLGLALVLAAFYGLAGLAVLGWCIL
jgi:hypothetical protein